MTSGSKRVKISSSKLTSSTFPSTGAQSTWPKADSRCSRIRKRLCSDESSRTMRLGPAAAIAWTKEDPMYPPAPVMRTDSHAWACEGSILLEVYKVKRPRRFPDEACDLPASLRQNVKRATNWPDLGFVPAPPTVLTKP